MASSHNEQEEQEVVRKEQTSPDILLEEALSAQNFSSRTSGVSFRHPEPTDMAPLYLAVSLGKKDIALRLSRESMSVELAEKYVTFLLKRDSSVFIRVSVLLEEVLILLLSSAHLLEDGGTDNDTLCSWLVTSAKPCYRMGQ